MLTCIAAMPFEKLGRTRLKQHGSRGRDSSLPALVDGDIAKPNAELSAHFLEPQSYSHTL